MARERPPADGLYVVQDGEWVGSIAIRFGFADWKTDVWKHARNAGLRNRRGNDPHTLAEGDELYIPPWQEHRESRSTEARHTFRMKVPSEVLRIRILDMDHMPIADEEYVLEVDFGSGGGTFKQLETRTSAEGIVTEPIPSTAISGKLTLPRLELVYPLRFGFLTPLDLSDRALLIRGAQERLEALGFEPGAIDGIEGQLTRDAVERFQIFLKENLGSGKPRITDPGPVDGIMGPKTRNALLEFYGC